MFRWLRRWLGYEEEPLEELVGGLSEPEAAMWAEMLRRQGTPAMVKTSTPLIGEMAGTATDYAVCVRAGDAARARDILSPLLKTHADPSRQPRRLRRRRGRRK
jgi:hypothetical protein